MPLARSLAILAACCLTARAAHAAPPDKGAILRMLVEVGSAHGECQRVGFQVEDTRAFDIGVRAGISPAEISEAYGPLAKEVWQSRLDKSLESWCEQLAIKYPTLIHK